MENILTSITKCLGVLLTGFDQGPTAARAGPALEHPYVTQLQFCFPNTLTSRISVRLVINQPVFLRNNCALKVCIHYVSNSGQRKSS